MSGESFRTERDSMGELQVPADALWGAQTQRAVENFPISGYRFGRRFIRALGLIKLAAAKVNAELGLLYDPASPKEQSFCRQWQLALKQRAPQPAGNMDAGK